MFSYAKLRPTIPNNKNESTSLDISLDLGVEFSYDQEFYYAVMNSTFTDPFLSKQLVQNIITATNSNGNLIPIGGSVISYGRERVESTSNNSFIKELQAIQLASGTTNVFKTGHKVFLFTLDKYGNVVWAVDGNNNYVEVKGTDWEVPITR